VALDASLERLATQQEKDAAIVSKLRGAMIYPLIVLVVILGVMIFMLVTVVPQVEKLYKDLHQELPVITQVMVGLSQFLTRFWWAVLIVLGIGAYLGVQYLRTEAGIRMLDALKLNMPGVSAMFRRLYMARFARTTQTLLVTGVAMLDTLKISSEAVGNTLISANIDKASEQVKGGKALSAALATQEYVPDLIPQMTRIGEQSGRIDEMMGKTAKIYEDELDQEIQGISTAIEPVLMVVLALIAASMVAAILLPIYGLVEKMSI